MFASRRRPACTAAFPALFVSVLVASLAACKRGGASDAPAAQPTGAQTATVVGLVTDVGGRGDHSFNDSALRGLETWAAGVRFARGAYEPLPDSERTAAILDELRATVTKLTIRPLVIQSKAQEDYQPNLQLVVDQGATLVIGLGFMLENAVEAVARANPQARFLLIDSPILDAKGTPISLPNVRTVVFREEEGSFLVGALAGLVAKERVGFVGGLELPLIKRFESGFRAGVNETNAAATVLVQYTGSFDNVAVGKQAATDLVAKGCEVLYHAAGSDGLGVIQAVAEAHASGKRVFAIGVDSDQSHLAPQAVLTSMIKRVDLAVWQAARDAAAGTFRGGDTSMGLKESGVGYAPVRGDLPQREQIVARVEALRARIVAGELRVPAAR